MKQRSSLPLSFTVFAVLLVVCLAVRLVPHLPNFTPVAATALFAGFYFRRAWVSVLVVSLAMLLPDMLLGTYATGVMITVYLSLLVPILAGRLLVKRVSFARVTSFTLLGSLFFFLTTNLAVWTFTPFYVLDLRGLGECYLAGLPFLKYTLAGDLFFSAVFFGCHAWATSPRLVATPARASIAS